jgi:PEP-CTERM motif
MRGLVFLGLTAFAGLVLYSGSALAGGPIAIPEPATLALLAAGIGGLAIAKFGRRK